MLKNYEKQTESIYREDALSNEKYLSKRDSNFLETLHKARLQKRKKEIYE